MGFSSPGESRATPNALARLLAMMLALAPATAAQEPLPAQKPIRVEVELTLVEATVKDRDGRTLGELKLEDFRLLEDGAEQKIAHFSRDQMPLAVALVVDLSGSIQPFLRPLRYATQSALKALKPEDRVALFTFAGQVERRVDLTADKAGVARVLDDVQAGGGTNINDAVYLAANYLAEEAPAARRVIVLVSDNVASDPGNNLPRAVVEAAHQADAAVYGLRVPGRNPVGIRVFRPRDLVSVKKLTEETGGEIFEVQQEGSLYLAFKALIERLKTRYTLGYYSTNTARDGRFRAIDLRLAPAHGTRGAHYSLLSKSGYYAPREKVN
jgi:Ca-activated chloride channel family protein